MRRLEQHLDHYVDAPSDSLVFAAPAGGPHFAWGQKVLEPAVQRAGVDGITFHGLRHSFVAIMVAAGCNVREVSQRAGHNSVAFTLTRDEGLIEDRYRRGDRPPECSPRNGVDLTVEMRRSSDP